MEVLAQIFPDIPEDVVQRVFTICDGSVEAASEWLCEHDWQELTANNDETNDDQNEEQQVYGTTQTNAALPSQASVPSEAPSAETAASGRLSRGPFGTPSEEEDEEYDEDEDDEDDEDDDNMYYDSGDEGGDGDGGVGRVGAHRVPPLTSRTKVTPSSDANGSTEQRFWVAFDDSIMLKSMIELLNLSLSKLAHQRVAILNTPTLDQAAAEAALLLTPPPSEATEPNPTKTGKRSHAAMEGEDALGYFAYFFNVSDLDMLWRSILHGHLLNRRFGDLLEFRSTKTREFDELMHTFVHVGRQPSSVHRHELLGRSESFKCALATPCTAGDMLRVGKNLHGVLSLATGSSLYFRANAAMPAPCGPSGQSGDGLAEVAFRAEATHRIRRLEVAGEPTGGGMGGPSVMGYQPPKRVEYMLQSLDDLSADEDAASDLPLTA